MEPENAHGEASNVFAEEGIVIIEGPAGVAFTMNPDAADETARRLIVAAASARDQNGSLQRVN